MGELDLPRVGLSGTVSFEVQYQASGHQTKWKDGEFRCCTLYAQSPAPSEFKTWTWVVSVAGIGDYREYRLQRRCGMHPFYHYKVKQERYQTVKRDQVPQRKLWRTHPQPIPSEKVEEAEETQPLPRKKEKGFLRRILGI